MTTPAEHNFTRWEHDRFETPIAETTVIDQGDMVAASIIDGKTLPMSAGSGLNFLGVAEDSNPVTSLGDKLTVLTVKRRGTFRFKTTAADSYAAYDSVYAGADAKTVRKTAAGSTLVGIVSPNQPGKSFPIAGGAAVTIDVIVKPAFPVD